jgi:hypothetical protein
MVIGIVGEPMPATVTDSFQVIVKSRFAPMPAAPLPPKATVGVVGALVSIVRVVLALVNVRVRLLLFESRSFELPVREIGDTVATRPLSPAAVV